MTLKWLDSNTTEDGHRVYSSRNIIKDNLKTEDNSADLVPYIEKTGDKANLDYISMSIVGNQQLYFIDKTANCTSNVFTIGASGTNPRVNGHGFSIGERIIVNSTVYYVMASDYSSTTFKLTATLGGSTTATFTNGSYQVKSKEPFINYRIAAYKLLPAPEEIALSEYWPVMNPGAAKLKLRIEAKTAFTRFKIPLTFEVGAVYNFAVDWGDNTRSFIYKQGTYDSTNLAEHIYTSAGQYIITIVGSIEGFSFNNSSSAKLLLEVISWGDLKFNGSEGGVGYYFYGCSNLTKIPNTDIALLFRGTANNLNFSGFFYLCSLFTSELSNWNTTRVVNMSFMFDGAKLFNSSLINWVTGNVTTMKNMFQEAEEFNQQIGGWDTSNVTDMSFMFRGAIKFNQPINNWNVNKVTTIESMFAVSVNKRSSSDELYGTESYLAYFYPTPGWEMSFNQPLNNWFTGTSPSIENLRWVFHGCKFFNQNISTWKIGKVTNMQYMFHMAEAYNNNGVSLSYNVNSWDTQLVTDIKGIFAGAKSFEGIGVNTWNLKSLYGQTTYNQADSSALAVFYKSNITQANYEAILDGVNGWASKLSYSSPSTRIIYFDGRPRQSTEVQRGPLKAKGWMILDAGTGNQFV